MSFETSYPFYVERFKQISELITNNPSHSGLYPTNSASHSPLWKGNVPFDDSVESMLVECEVHITENLTTTTVHHPQIGTLAVTHSQKNSSWAWYPAIEAPMPLPGYFGVSFQDLPGGSYLVRRLIDDSGTCIQLMTFPYSVKIVITTCEGSVFEADAHIRGTESMLPVVCGMVGDYPTAIELIEPLFSYSELVSGISRNYEDTVRMNLELLNR